jgi:hypothetical protein
MRFFIISILLSCSLAASAQTNFGLKFAPTLSYNKATGDGISKNGAGIRYNFGLWSESNLSGSDNDNVKFYTGVFYANKRIGYSYDMTDVNSGNNIKIDAVSDLQYFQVPVGLKFISDEIFENGRIYVLLGVANDFKVSEHTKTNISSSEVTNNFQIYDINFLAGLGLEYKLSEHNAFIIGLSHTRGLTNLYKNKDGSNIELKSRIFALDLGIKF